MTIELGDLVEDRISGYSGIVVAMTHFINGCTQCTIVKKLKKGEKLEPMGDPSIDIQSLKIIKKKAYNKDEEEEKQEKVIRTGGATRINNGMRGY